MNTRLFPWPPGAMGWWKNVLLILATWLFSAATQYGIMAAKLNEHDRRLATLENKTFITREEYSERQREMFERLNAIESKLDRNYRARGER